jgi:hypothetical protein
MAADPPDHPSDLSEFTPMIVAGFRVIIYLRLHHR